MHSCTLVALIVVVLVGACCGSYVEEDSFFTPGGFLHSVFGRASQGNEVVAHSLPSHTENSPTGYRGARGGSGQEISPRLKSCWVGALNGLHGVCSQIEESPDSPERQSFALDLTACHLARSGRPFTCSSGHGTKDGPACLKKISSHEFELYTMFFQHAVEECRFLQQSDFWARSEDAQKGLLEASVAAAAAQKDLIDAVEATQETAMRVLQTVRPLLAFWKYAGFVVSTWVASGILPRFSRARYPAVAWILVCGWAYGTIRSFGEPLYPVWADGIGEVEQREEVRMEFSHQLTFLPLSSHPLCTTPPAPSGSLPDLSPRTAHIHGANKISEWAYTGCAAVCAEDEVVAEEAVWSGALKGVGILFLWAFLTHHDPVHAAQRNASRSINEVSNSLNGLTDSVEQLIGASKSAVEQMSRASTAATEARDDHGHLSPTAHSTTATFSSLAEEAPHSIMMGRWDTRGARRAPTRIKKAAPPKLSFLSWVLRMVTPTAPLSDDEDDDNDSESDFHTDCEDNLEVIWVPTTPEIPPLAHSIMQVLGAARGTLLPEPTSPFPQNEGGYWSAEEDDDDYGDDPESILEDRKPLHLHGGAPSVYGGGDDREEHSHRGELGYKAMFKAAWGGHGRSPLEGISVSSHNVDTLWYEGPGSPDPTPQVSAAPSLRPPPSVMPSPSPQPSGSGCGSLSASSSTVGLSYPPTPTPKFNGDHDGPALPNTSLLGSQNAFTPRAGGQTPNDTPCRKYSPKRGSLPPPSPSLSTHNM